MPGIVIKGRVVVLVPVVEASFWDILGHLCLGQ